MMYKVSIQSMTMMLLVSSIFLSFAKLSSSFVLLFGGQHQHGKIPTLSKYHQQQQQKQFTFLRKNIMISNSRVYASRKNNRRNRKNDKLGVEKELFNRGFHPIIGSDESGRGSIAGPVVAASCCILVPNFNDYEPIPFLDDSKKLSPEQRLAVYDEVMNHPEIYCWHVAQRSNEQIDNSNILLATVECFKESIEGVSKKLPAECVEKAYSIVDGNKTPKLDNGVPCRPWVKGDEEVYTVMLASVLARVSVDNLMKDIHLQYPKYGFNIHNGYATHDHILSIHNLGPSPVHRMSFKQLKGREVLD